ncbi:MAG: hypothetical protein OXE84_07070 [Rhodobacteraceae bacterium]|nr:hypothetical protein [Paracoccaceae bacterium]MCY4195984.1 hypothetical protein [Paracoccaceae bacterium]
MSTMKAEYRTDIARLTEDMAKRETRLILAMADMIGLAVVILKFVEGPRPGRGVCPEPITHKEHTMRRPLSLFIGRAWRKNSAPNLPIMSRNPMRC